MADDLATYLESIPNARRKRDAETMMQILSRATGEKPRLWGSIVGFGEYHYVYDSGREGDAPAAAFSARKAATTIYLANGSDAYSAELERLGPHTTGVVCLYVKDLAAVDLELLESIVADSYRVASAEGFGRQERG